ncbi:hypothetical protein HYT84_01205 [Candidatus Micrarchaeota archaeon]|nr:hypothetical protein [Candidatus Micrarchaeota archaeon]
MKDDNLLSKMAIGEYMGEREFRSPVERQQLSEKALDIIYNARSDSDAVKQLQNAFTPNQLQSVAKDLAPFPSKLAIVSKAISTYKEESPFKPKEVALPVKVEKVEYTHSYLINMKAGKGTTQYLVSFKDPQRTFGQTAYAKKLMDVAESGTLEIKKVNETETIVFGTLRPADIKTIKVSGTEAEKVQDYIAGFKQQGKSYAGLIAGYAWQ